MENSELLGEYDTEPKYRLFENGAFPMMIVDEEDGYSITGEIWDVPYEDINEIDMHEALYDRREIEIEGFHEVFAYIYLLPIYAEYECYGLWG